MSNGIDLLYKQKNETKDCNAKAIADILEYLCMQDSRVAELVIQDLTVREMSIEKCSKALYDYASKHKSGSSWSCGGTIPTVDNPAVKVILDFYKIPTEWVQCEGNAQSVMTEPERKTEKVVPFKPVDLFDFI